MAQTYAQLLKQIAELQEKAAQLRKAEVAEVVAKIKEAIDFYGLTTDDLFNGSPAGPAKRQRAARPSGARFADSNGNSWSGRGPRPQWLRDALAGGKSIEEFRVAGSAAAEGAAAPRAAAKGKGAKPAQSRVKYRDDAGHTWSGFGPKPKWLKDALDAGKTLDDLKA